MASMLQANKFLAMAGDFLDRDRLDQAGDMYIAAGRELQKLARSHPEPRRRPSAALANAGINPGVRAIYTPRFMPGCETVNETAEAYQRRISAFVDDAARGEEMFDTSDIGRGGPDDLESQADTARMRRGL